jgi:hypothetical protein
MHFVSHRHTLVFVIAVIAAGLLITADARTQESRTQEATVDAAPGFQARVTGRLTMAAAAPALRSDAPRISAMTPADRRAAVDAVWGPGLPTAQKLEIFDKFWNAVDTQFAAFHGIDDDWAALRARYRPEVAAGVSRGRFAAIINRMSLSLREGHTIPLDLLVNVFTLPEPGVPLFGIGAWFVDTSGACLTAQDDGSALVYDVVPTHPLGLQRGDRILGYDGTPWRDLYQRLIDEELPMWPLWWGSGPEGFEHSFVMSAGLNWHHFETMDVFKHATGTVVHLPTSLMPGVVFSPLCTEQLPVPGVTWPGYFGGDLVRSGVVQGTNIGYIYVYAWSLAASMNFAAAVHELTQVRQVDGLIIDFRFNTGGLIRGSMTGLAALFDHPETTIGSVVRMRADDHLHLGTPNVFLIPDFWRVDFDLAGQRDKASFDGPIAMLVGPGAVSAADFGAFMAAEHPRLRSFGKTTGMAIGLPTQPSLRNELFLHPDWDARIAVTNTYKVGQPHDYLIHTDFPVDERVWLRPADVAAGKDTVVEAALRWLRTELAPAQ